MWRGAASSSSPPRWSAPGTAAAGPDDGVRATGKAYLAFARTEPAYYSAMFEAGVPLETSPELTAAGDRAFAVIRAASERLIERVPRRKASAGADDGAAYLVAVARHRVAVRRGDAGRRKLPMTRGGTAGGRRAGLPARASASGAHRPQLRDRRSRPTA